MEYFEKIFFTIDIIMMEKIQDIFMNTSKIMKFVNFSLQIIPKIQLLIISERNLVKTLSHTYIVNSIHKSSMSKNCEIEFTNI